MSVAQATMRVDQARADETIPVLDLGPYRAGRPGALAALAAELRQACEQVGFYFLANHGVPQSLIDRVFGEVARFHAQPLDAKRALKIDHHNIGYMAMAASVTRTSQVNVNTKPNLNEAFFVKRERTQDDPDVIAGTRFKGMNRWPADLPGFRAVIVQYCEALEQLALSLLPVYATALDLPADWFAAHFVDAQYSLRMSHYPPVEAYGDNEFGSAPHTDSSFFTMLAPNQVPGLEIGTRAGKWLPAPPLDGAFVVNTGDMGHRWTNGRFLSTPHRVRNLSGIERYAIPFFFDAHADAVMECIPTCAGPGNPPKFEPVTYTEYMNWFMSRNYDHARQGLKNDAPPGTAFKR
ncbi:MAG: 2-oxoglutarate and iron-dependent oxygenase domain-containing protein [Pseudomonadota bacterium]